VILIEKKLIEMSSGEKGIVIGVESGERMISRLEALGVYQGIEIMLISSQFMRGPVTIQAGRTKIALGRGMAEKIKVKTE